MLVWGTSCDRFVRTGRLSKVGSMRYGAATCEACVDADDLLLVLGVVLLLQWAIFHIPGIDEQGTLQTYGMCLNL